MLAVTDQAHEKFTEYFKNQEPKPIRVFWAEGG